MHALKHMPDEVSGKKVQMEESTPAVRRATAIPHTVAHGGSWHGGDMGFFGALSGIGAAAATPAEREAQNSFRRENTPWTVHDGQFFAKTFGDEEDEKKPRAPQEKRYKRIKRHQLLLGRADRRRLREMGMKASTIEKLALRGAELLNQGKSDKVVVPEKLQGLGGKVIKLQDFRMEVGLHSLIGLGSFSSVHRATRIADEQAVAVKIFHHPVKVGVSSDASVHGVSSGPDPRMRPESDFDADDAKCFVREVACLEKSAGAHENIVTYLGHGFVNTPDGLAGFIAMELVQGADLYDTVFRSPRGSMRLTSAVRWAVQIASALAHLHAHGIVHRDIKESNIMLSGLPSIDATSSTSSTDSSTTGRSSSSATPRLAGEDAILIDLGLAVPLPAHGKLPWVAPGFGVVGYRAPEVHQRKAYDGAVDVFAFGRVLLHMLRAVHPPPRDRRSPVLKAHACTAVKLLLSAKTRHWAYETIWCKPLVNPSWPKHLSEVVLQCLEPDPRMRPKSSDLATLMHKLVEGDTSVHKALEASAHKARTGLGVQL